MDWSREGVANNSKVGSSRSGATGDEFVHKLVVVVAAAGRGGRRNQGSCSLAVSVPSAGRRGKLEADGCSTTGVAGVVSRDLEDSRSLSDDECMRGGGVSRVSNIKERSVGGVWWVDTGTD